VSNHSQIVVWQFTLMTMCLGVCVVAIRLMIKMFLKTLFGSSSDACGRIHAVPRFSDA
jgi:hypothetical protein